MGPQCGPALKGSSRGAGSHFVFLNFVSKSRRCLKFTAYPYSVLFQKHVLILHPEHCVRLVALCHCWGSSQPPAHSLISSSLPLGDGTGGVSFHPFPVEKDGQNSPLLPELRLGDLHSQLSVYIQQGRKSRQGVSR